MALKIVNMTNPKMNLVAFSGNPKPDYPLGHLNIKKVSDTCSRQSLVASGIEPQVAAKVVETGSCLARLWREVQGLNNWENLIEPLNPLLQQEIIRYGEFVTACYKAFDLDPNSKRYLNCKYGKQSMLQKVGMPNSGYEITKYIYATPDINIPTQTGATWGRWIGYVAVSSDEEVKRIGRRDLMVTFRGTVTSSEWVANFMSTLTPARLDPYNLKPNVKVEAGFLSLYTCNESDNKFATSSCREQLLREVSRLLKKYEGEEISITLTGHSMGSSLALLLAYDLAELGLNRDSFNNKIPITVFSFGGPRVGNSEFKERCDKLGLKVLRIVNVNDPIPKMPGVFFNEKFRVLVGNFEFPSSCSCYAHVGIEIALDFFMIKNPSCVHDLEMYIRLIKCPKAGQIRKKGLDILDRAKGFLLSAQKVNTLEWTSAAMTIVNIVQSQRT